MICPSCKAFANDKDKYCQKCGKKLISKNIVEIQQLNFKKIKYAYICNKYEKLNKSLIEQTNNMKNIISYDIKKIEDRIIFRYYISDLNNIVEVVGREIIKIRFLIKIINNLIESVKRLKAMGFKDSQIYLDKDKVYLDKDFNVVFIVLPIENRHNKDTVGNLMYNILLAVNIDSNEKGSFLYFQKIIEFVKMQREDILGLQQFILDIDKRILEIRYSSNNYDNDKKEYRNSMHSDDEGTTVLCDEGTTISTNEIELFMIRKSNDEKIEIEGEKFYIGSSQKNNYVVKGNSAVSRRHCVLIKDNGGNVFIQDLNSTNGTFVNGERAKENDRIQLHSKDEVKLGDEIYIYYEEEV